MTNKRAQGMTLLIVLGLTGGAVSAAEEGSVKITSPEDGATLNRTADNKVAYVVTPGPGGHHVHLYVDDAEVGILKQLTGSYPLPALDTGPHNICIRVVNRAHVPVGLVGCVKVTVK